MSFQEFRHLLRKGEIDEAQAILDTLQADEIIKTALQSLIDSEKGDYATAEKTVAPLYEELKDKGDNYRLLIVAKSYCLALGNSGQLEKTEKIAQDAISRVDESDLNNREVLDALGYICNNLGNVIFRMGRLMEALQAYMSGLSYRVRLEDNYLIALSFGNIAIIHTQLGNYIESEQYYLKSLDSFVSAGFIYETRITRNNLGVVYLDRGLLKQAEQEFQQAMELSKEYNDESLMSTVLNNMGNMARAKYDLKAAASLYEESYEIRKRIGTPFQLAYCYYYLTRNNIDLNDRENAKKYLDKLLELTNAYPENKSFQQMYQVINGFYLKSSSRQQSRFKARQIFQDILNSDSEYDSDSKINALLMTCEFLLEELKQAENKESEEVQDEIIAEIKEYTHMMLDIAKEGRHINLEVQAKFLMAYIALSEVDIERADSLIAEAENLAEQHGFKYFSIKAPSPTNSGEKEYTAGSIETKISINKIIHSLPKLKIIFYLFDKDFVPFTELRKELGFSAGNLGKQCDQLVDVNYIEKTKVIDEDSKFVTVYRLTEEGVNEFRKYANHLKNQFQITEMI